MLDTAFIVATASPGEEASVRLVTDADPGNVFPDAKGRRYTASSDAVALRPKLGDADPDDRAIVKRVAVSGDPLPHLWPGDVVLCDAVGMPGGRGGVDIQAIRGMRILGNAEDDASALALLAATEDAKPRGVMSPLKTAGDLAFEAAAETARMQKDEVLVLAWREQDGGLGTGVLAHRGPFLFWQEFSTGRHCDARTSGLDDPPGPGLWLLADGATWSTRDHETGTVDFWGLKGAMTATTLGEAAPRFALDGEELARTAEHVYPYMLEVPLMEAIQLPEGVRATTAGMA